MRIIEYSLEPEAYGANGKFVDKKGTVANLILDNGILIGLPFDKVIPEFKVLNKVLLEGFWPRSGWWTPFEITEEEYDELVEYLLALPLNRPFRVEKRV
ncbi:hypothetical protein GNF80_03935 [Clostridium perfringens]|nr:hypothetical protein [Clostridium perfringens]